ncbi:MAG: endonuclease Q family protein [Candidatus Woykebacteria bacterium]
MKFVADLHLHSAYARATSKNLNFDTLSEWAKYKGINLLSSADFTHPVWFRETKEQLKESGNGLYKYKDTNFVLGSEISCIYSQGGKVRRIHCLLYFPDLKDVEEFNSLLGKRANLVADGRPIIGLSARDLLELALSVSDKAILIPAHAWTPWFSLYGSNSGFDSIEECFGDLSAYIYAIETGLSSDPAMNWRIKDLDKRSIVSFSDAHSAPKMGRELTIFDTDFSYDGLLEALKSPKQAENTDERSEAKALFGSRSAISLTIEFFPEEGKYHFTGHRNCDVKHSPEETDKYGVICPVCKRKLTVGVMHRVNDLAEKDRGEDFKPDSRPSYKMLVPLLEILSEALGASTASDRVRVEYTSLVNNFSNEMAVLLKATAADIAKISSNPRVAEGIDRVRRGDIAVDPGFDGVFGTVKIWPTSDRLIRESPAFRKVQVQAEGQTKLFE